MAFLISERRTINSLKLFVSVTRIQNNGIVVLKGGKGVMVPCQRFNASGLNDIVRKSHLLVFLVLTGVSITV